MKTSINCTRVEAPNHGLEDPIHSTVHREDEILPLNPFGRNKIDGAGINRVKNKFMKCKEIINIATLNVRTLSTTAKKTEIIHHARTKGINILGIQDHKIVHKEGDSKIKTDIINGYTVITSSAWRNNRNAAIGGVGVILDKYAANSLAKVEPFNNRIMIIHLTGNPSTTVIIQYTPTEGSSECESHFENLLNAISMIPKHNVLVVLDDFNAHIGEIDAKYTYHLNTNKNGQHLLDLSSEKNLVITNTTFQKRRGKLWTYLSDMSGNKTQIDYILINRKWKNSVKNVEAYNSFSSIGSDHRVLTARLKLSLRSSKTLPKDKQHDWKLLQTDEDLQQRYAITVRNRYEILLKQDESATERYQHFIDANKKTADDLIPRKKRKSRKDASNDKRVIEKRTIVNEAFVNYEKSPTPENQESLQAAKMLLYDAYQELESEELERMVQQVIDADMNSRHKDSWNLVNDITGRKIVRKGILKGNSKESRLKSWHSHFSSLLGSEPTTTINTKEEIIQPIFDNLGITTGPFTMEEYIKAKNKITEGKAFGSDMIPPEVLKRCNLDDIVLQYANDLLLKNEKPDQWSKLDIIPVPKKGDLSCTDNYRGISLSSIVSKTINRLILNRIKPALDGKLRNNQNGFRPKRSTSAQILALRRIIEGVKANNLKCSLLFIDFKKAFDSVHRGMMLKILEAYGIPQELVRSICQLYKGTQARVLTADGETEYFDLMAGVLQGDTLAPYIFVIIIDYVMRKTIGEHGERLGFQLERRRSRRVGPVYITDLDFADDLALLASEIRNAQEMLTRLEMEASKVGLHLNVEKTEVMVFNQENDFDIKAKSGEIIKNVDEFKYLGSYIGSSTHDVKVRKALAWAACNKMRNVWKSTLPRKSKIRLFTSTVESILLYGCETWTLTKAEEKSLDGSYTRMLRTALNIRWQDHITNEEVYGCLPKVSWKIAERRCRLAGHCVRHPEEEASKTVLWIPTGGRVNRGRKATTYIDTLKRDTGLQDTNELRATMLDRNTWKDYVSLARTGVPPK